MNTILTVVKKELNSVLRDRTMIIAILIQLFIASFSSALLLGMLSLYDADTIVQYGGLNINMGLVGESVLPLQTALTARGVRVVPYATLDQATNAYYQGKLNAILEMPQDNNGVVEIKLYLPDTESTALLIRMIIQDPLKQYENYLREQRGITVNYTGLKGKPATSFEFIYSILLPILMFFPAFVAGSMTIDAITEEVENNTLHTLLSAPLTINGMLAAKIIASVLLAAIQCLVWLALLALNRITVHNSGWVLLLGVIIAGTTAAGAALVAVFFKDRERSQFFYSLALITAAGVSYLLDISPIKVLSRLAIGDYYTGGWNVALFAGLLAVLLILLWKVSHRLTQ
jgi:ABC-2 type transport system permease protein